MDPVVATILAAVDWKAVGKKLATSAVTDAGNTGRKKLLQFFQSDENAKKAIALFAEEFLKEVDSTTPLSAAIDGYQDQLRRLIEAAAPDIVCWMEPDIKPVDFGPVQRMWSGDPLPEDFDWNLVAQNYAGALRRYIKKNPELRSQLALALQEDSRSFEQRFAPGFDLAGYRDYLQKKCGMLQLSAMHASAYDRRISLWSVFVAQSARASAPVRDIPVELLRQLRREGHSIQERDELQLERLRESYQSSPSGPVLDILARERCVVILGDPGSGKTSLLRYLAVGWATEDHGPLPLWVDLRQYAEKQLGFTTFLDSGAAGFRLDAREVTDRLQQGDAVFYLDGLDEIFQAHTRVNVIEEIAAYSARFSNARFVVTSRIFGYEPERLRHAGFMHATLEEFDDAQMRDFLQKWHAVAEDDLKDRMRLQARLERAAGESRSIRELAGNPLLLTMMAILNRNQELPRDRVELYREASRVLLHEWDAHRALPTDTFARQEKEELLRELAGAMQQSEGGLAGNYIDRGRLIQIFRGFLQKLGIPEYYAKAESLVRQLTDRNFILCYAGVDRFSFVHRTFLEYFCADWFREQFQKQHTLTLDQLKSEVFGRHWRDEKWHEVLRLIAGMVDEKHAEKLILFLMEQDGRAYKLANLFLAAGCLSEVRKRQAIQRTDQILRRRLMEDAVPYDPLYYYERWEESEEVQPTRTRAVGLIATMWRSVETQDWLFSSASRSRDWIVRRAAVQELARGWKEDGETLPLLKDRARNDKDIDVRMAAVQELARGWKEDGETLPLLKDRARSDENYAVRRTAVEELARGWNEDRETLPWLKDRARNDENYAVRRAAVRELARGWKEDGETLPLLKDRARNDKDNDVRMAAVEELARGWKEDGETLLLLKDRARNDTDNDVRTAAVEELARGWKEDGETLPLLKDLARNDENYDVRRVAVEELARGWKEDGETLPLLKDRARNDADETVRMVAVRELARGWKEDGETLPWLKDHARNNENDIVRMVAMQELARGWKADVETLPLLKDRARNDENYDMRRAAVQELARGWKDDGETLPWLKDRARNDENSAVRRAAVEELARGWKEDGETLPLLKDRACSDTDIVVRRVAVQELARGWKEDGETLLLLKDRARSDESDDVRKAAVGELARGWKDDPEVIAILREREMAAEA